MSRGFNKSVIVGNVARDPDIRYLSTGKDKFARLAVAVGRQWKNRDTGEIMKQVDFIPVLAWNFHADLAEKYIKKGSSVLVEGRIQVKKFTDSKTGADRWSTDVVAENIVLLGGRRDDNQQGGAPNGGGSAQPAKGAESQADDDAAGFEYAGDYEAGDVDVPF
jgi:single-strand DNA-binding protein